MPWCCSVSPAAVRVTARTLTFLNPTLGTEQTMTFVEFVRMYEQGVTDDPTLIEDPTAPLRSQIVHLMKTRRSSAAEGSEFQVAGPFIKIHAPVHESITIAGLRGTLVPVPPGVGPGTDQATNEFLRGVIWNDDPELLLFSENLTNNYAMTQGLAWLKRFSEAERTTINDKTNLTGRSHFFDLQFLHAMAEEVGEEPEEHPREGAALGRGRLSAFDRRGGGGDRRDRVDPDRLDGHALPVLAE